MLAKIVNTLGVEVNELFTINLASVESSDLLTHLSEDMTKNVNLAMVEVFKRYMG